MSKDLGRQKYKFSRKRVLEYVASASNGVSRNDVMNAFTDTSELADQVDRALKALSKSGALKQSPDRKKYTAKHPYADTVYATVQRMRDGDKKRRVKLWGRPKGSIYGASITEKDIRKHDLQLGDTVVVRLATGKGLQRGAKVLKKCDGVTPVHIQGFFNSGGIGLAPFEAADRNIKTAFNIRSKPNADFVHRGVYDALLPLDMKIDAPEVVLLEDNGIDRESGADINRILLRKYGVPYRFSAPALMEASSLEHRPFLKSHREDLTQRNFVTIDPPGAKDLDDAVDVLRVENGWRMTIAIADLCDHITYGMSLDEEAHRRGNTFYLPEKNYQLYPDFIVEKFSLLYDRERPSTIYEAYFDDSFNLLHGRTGFAFIRTKEQMTYDQFYERLHAGDPSLQDVHEFHQGLQEKFWHAQHGRALAQRVFSNAETGYVSHGFIETAMVMANQGVAKQLHEAGISVPFRNHGPMVHPEAYAEMARELAYLGFDISENPYDCDWNTLDAIWDQAKVRGIQSRVEEVLRTDFFDRAFYEAESRGHFALGIPHYTHFTSPIRRDSDKIVARGLRRLHGVKKGALSDKEIAKMPDLCEHYSRMNRLDKDIQSDRSKYRLINILQTGEERRATVLHVGKSDVEIMLSNGLRNRLNATALAVGGWEIDSDNREIVRIAHGEEERVGRDQPLRGKIGAVHSKQALWEFLPMEAPAPTVQAEPGAPGGP